MSNERAKQMGGGRMDGPTLVYTATSQASAAGGATTYAFVSCFGAKSVTFLVRTAAGVANISSSTVDLDPGGGLALITGVVPANHNIDYVPGSNGTFVIYAGDKTNTYGKTDFRFWADRLAPRVTLAVSATGVSCWAITQWD